MAFVQPADDSPEGEVVNVQKVRSDTPCRKYLHHPLITGLIRSNRSASVRCVFRRVNTLILAWIGASESP